MTVAVVGAGALGRTFAAGLVAAGGSVTLGATTRSLDELRSAGAVRIHGGLDLEIPVADGAGTSGVLGLVRTAEIDEADGLVFATKAHQLHDAIAATGPLTPEWVLGLQNGIGKDDVLTAAFGSPRVLRCVTTVAAERRPDGEVTVSNLGATYVGELDPLVSDRATAVAMMFATAGLRTEARSDLAQITWSKAANVAGTFGVDLLTRASWVDAMESEHLTRIFLGLAREVALLAAADGAPVEDYPGLPAKSYATAPPEASIEARRERIRQMRAGGASLDRRSSLQQDLALGRETEAEVIFGELVDRADLHGLEVPRLELVRDVARAHAARQTAR